MRKGERRKQDFMAIAAELFANKGYVETTVQDILDASGVSKGSFYHHFNTKFDVLLNIGQAQAQSALKEFIDNSPADAVEALNLMLYHVSFLSPFALPLARALPTLQGFEGNALLSSVQDAYHAAFIKPLTGLIQRLKLNDLAIYADEASLELALYNILGAFGRLLLCEDPNLRNRLLRAARRSLEATLGLRASCLAQMEYGPIKSALDSLHP